MINISDFIDYEIKHLLVGDYEQDVNKQIMVIINITASYIKYIVTDKKRNVKMGFLNLQSAIDYYNTL